jgi:chromosome segregation ATPase
MTIEEKLDKAKALAQEMERKRIQLETRLENTLSQKKDLLAKCEQLGITPEELDEKIAKLQSEIEEGMKEIESILPKEKTSDSELPY